MSAFLGAKRTVTNRCLPISIYEYTASFTALAATKKEGGAVYQPPFPSLPVVLSIELYIQTGFSPQKPYVLRGCSGEGVPRYGQKTFVNQRPCKTDPQTYPQTVSVWPFCALLLGRVLINRQPNADLDVPLNVRYWG
jgi:hypothetical protein